MSGPNGFAFFLGQNQTAIGPVVIYEFDFEGGRDGTLPGRLEIGMTSEAMGNAAARDSFKEQCLLQCLSSHSAGNECSRVLIRGLN